MPAPIRLILALAAFAAAAVVSAAQEVQTLSLTPSINLNGAGQSRTGWDANLDFTKFDTTKGALTSVSLVFDWTGTISGSVTNLSASPNSPTIQHDLFFDLTNRDPFDVAHFVNTSVLSYTFSPSLAVGGGPQAIVPKTGMGSLDASSFVTMGMFTGAGAIDLNLYAHGATTQLGGGPIATAVDTFAGVKATLTYNYTPFAPTVPGPSAALAMGLGALRVVRRRKAR